MFKRKLKRVFTLVLVVMLIGSLVFGTLLTALPLLY